MTYAYINLSLLHMACWFLGLELALPPLTSFCAIKLHVLGILWRLANNVLATYILWLTKTRYFYNFYTKHDKYMFN